MSSFIHMQRMDVRVKKNSQSGTLFFNFARMGDNPMNRLTHHKAFKQFISQHAVSFLLLACNFLLPFLIGLSTGERGGL